MIDKKLLDQVEKKQLSNIVSKIKEGKTLSAQEQALLDRERETTDVGFLSDATIVRTAELVEFLGITAQRIAELAKDGLMVKQSNGRYYARKSIQNYIRMLQKNRKSKHGASATMEELRHKLVEEQARKESAIASLRELELKMKAENLIPESEATEIIIKLLTPLRRLLDALPRQISSNANPTNPAIAELAIRNGLDDRIYAEIESILKTEVELTKSE